MTLHKVLGASTRAVEHGVRILLFRESSAGIRYRGLWRMKTLFESGPKSNASHEASKTIWIFSDMMNETPDLPMPALIDMGPEQMLERARQAVC
jgi:hypothetical protein